MEIFNYVYDKYLIGVWHESGFWFYLEFYQAIQDKK